MMSKALSLLVEPAAREPADTVPGLCYYHKIGGYHGGTDVWSPVWFLVRVFGLELSRSPILALTVCTRMDAHSLQVCVMGVGTDAAAVSETTCRATVGVTGELVLHS